MNRNNFSALVISILLATVVMSCKKDTLASIPPTPTPIDTTRHHIQPTEIEVTIYSWNDIGNGFFTNTLYNVVSQLNTSHSTSIKVYLVTNGHSASLDRPVTFDNGILIAQVLQSDVHISYQSFSKAPPRISVTVKIVAS